MKMVSKNQKVNGYQVEYESGKEHGLWQQWYENGQQKSKSEWVSGEKHGLEWTWDSDGNLLSKDHYQNGKIIQ